MFVKGTLTMTRVFHLSMGALHMRIARMGKSRTRLICTTLLLMAVVAMGLVGWPQRAWAAHEEEADRYSGRGCLLHEIVLGENLTRIAAQYEVTVEMLVAENEIEDADLIVEKHVLCIPPRNARTYASLSNWESYGVPGQSYDPALIGKAGGPAPSNNANVYGPQERPSSSASGYPGMIPGQSYDPATLNKAGQPQTGGYWKDEARYPAASVDEIDPNDGEDLPEEPEEEPEEPEEPNGEEPNGEDPDGEENGEENGEGEIIP
jgi:hypothetical protein